MRKCDIIEVNGRFEAEKIIPQPLGFCQVFFEKFFKKIFILKVDFLKTKFYNYNVRERGVKYVFRV